MLLPTFLQRNISECLAFFLPAACPWCGSLLPTGKKPDDLCSACSGSIQPLGPCCPCCAVPLTTLGTISHYCGGCLKDPPSFRKVHAVGKHANTLKQAIHRFKYRDNPALNASLARLLNESLDKSLAGFQPDLVIPVPTPSRRLKQRGYNQALELARPVAKHLQIPLAIDLLQRSKSSATQQGLSAKQRQENLREAFALHTSLRGEKILLIDDVMTTTATARECARALIRGGAGSVHVAVLARA
jgi:ComF family protein